MTPTNREEMIQLISKSAYTRQLEAVLRQAGLDMPDADMVGWIASQVIIPIVNGLSDYGLAIVPVEATKEMLESAHGAKRPFKPSIYDVIYAEYRAAIAASPFVEKK